MRRACCYLEKQRSVPSRDSANRGRAKSVGGYRKKRMRPLRLFPPLSQVQYVTSPKYAGSVADSRGRILLTARRQLMRRFCSGDYVEHLRSDAGVL
ncbi:hypothetical protein J6590_038895 [Homalodisca vitripennis]|nr:hypothetical protein J6590_038895 [Homalodisca vitripennis]